MVFLSRPSIIGSQNMAVIVSEAKRLKSIEDQNYRLKQMVAEQAIDNRILKATLKGNDNKVLTLKVRL